MSVHAHPDDEVFSTGGTLAKYAEQRVHTVLVTSTYGEEGEIVDPTLNTEETRAHLGEVRTEELRCAVAALGIETLEFLGYRDSGMAGTASNDHTASFHQADLEEATGRLVRLVRTYRPHVLMSYDPNGSYGHPDHIKAHKITVKAFDAAGDPSMYPEAGPIWQPKKLYYSGMSSGQFDRWRRLAVEAGLDSPWLNRARPEGEERRGLPAEEITTFIEVKEYLPRKIAAFRCHRTQIRDDFFFYTVPEEFARRAFFDECFIRVRSLVEAPVPEDDLLAGLR
jgi:mycothiol conjugate amidase Mca